MNILIDRLVKTSQFASDDRTSRRFLQLSLMNNQSKSSASIVTLFNGSSPSGNPVSNSAVSFLFSIIFLFLIISSLGNFSSSSTYSPSAFFCRTFFNAEQSTPPCFSIFSMSSSCEMMLVWHGKTSCSIPSCQGTNCSMAIYGGWKVAELKKSMTCWFSLERIKANDFNIIFVIQRSVYSHKPWTMISKLFGLWDSMAWYKAVLFSLSGFRICSDKDFSV